MNWARPFLDRLGCRPTEASDLVEAAGAIPDFGRNKPIPFVVAKHPQGKAESDWVEEVISSFQCLEKGSDSIQDGPA